MKAEEKLSKAMARAISKKIPVRHKYNAQITVRDGMKFASKKEAKFYDQLKFEQKAGFVLFFLRQVPIHLPGGVKMVIDFQVFYSDGRVDFIDAKGKRTAQYIAKKKIVEALYPFEIREV